MGEDPGGPLELLPSPHHSLLASIVQCVHQATAGGHDGTVLLPGKLPRRHCDRLLQGRRSAVLAAPRRRTVVAPCRLGLTPAPRTEGPNASRRPLAPVEGVVQPGGRAGARFQPDTL
ncbi:hypothetical protein [Kitasatospora purpeofusca]|uniref:hypothetical protein n=1 Tax=Kitasatospora purpeofusca TaxID=67352 RepID=UPI00366595B6